MKTNLIGVGSFDSEQDAWRILKQEAKKFEEIARKEWNLYMSSYTPKRYVRTKNSLKAIQVKYIPIKVDSDEIGIEITWDNDLSYHPSVVKRDGRKGHAILLISAGWKAKKLRKYLGRDIPRFTEYEGYGYLTKVIESYNAVKDARISLELEVLVKTKRKLK